jgi:hypothetical protein
MGHRLVSGPYLEGEYNRRRVVPAIVTFGSTGDGYDWGKDVHVLFKPASHLSLSVLVDDHNLLN